MINSEVYKKLMNSLVAKHSLLMYRGEIDTLEQIALIISWLCHEIKEADYQFKKLVRETEYELGFRIRFYKKSDTDRSRKGEYHCCEKHPDRKGVYIIEGKYYCRSCGVCIRRKMKKETW